MAMKKYQRADCPEWIVEAEKVDGYYEGFYLEDSDGSRGTRLSLTDEYFEEAYKEVPVANPQPTPEPTIPVSLDVSVPVAEYVEIALSALGYTEEELQEAIRVIGPLIRAGYTGVPA